MIKDTEQIRDRYATGATWLKTRYSEAHTEFNDWYAEEIRKAKEEAWDAGRYAVIQYAVGYVENDPEELAGYIDQHVVAIGGSKLDNPYRKEDA